MVIRKLDDVYSLMKARIEAIEDLDCEELSECISAFMSITGTMTMLDQLKHMHSIRPIEGDREAFEMGLRTIEAGLSIIDKLTLRDDAAE